MNSCIWSMPIKDGVNQSLANIAMKRLVISSEPTGSQSICNTTMRALIGGDSLAVRGAYDKDTKKQNNATYIMELNDMLEFMSRIEYADLRRLVEIELKSTFVCADEVDEENHRYLADESVDTMSWRHRYRCALMRILIDTWKDLRGHRVEDFCPEEFKEGSKRYLISGGKVMKWFTDVFEVVDKKDADESTIMPMREIYARFQGSSYYDSLTKKDKRSFGSRKALLKELLNLDLLKLDFVKERKVKGKCRKSCFYNVRLRPDDLDYETDDEDGSDLEDTY